MIAINRCIILLFIVLSNTIVSYSQITIEQCYQLAKENYPSIKQYDLIRQSEHYTLTNASKGYLPQISLTGKATYQSEVTKMPIPPSLLQGVSIDPLSKDQYQLLVDVSQSIWDGGSIRSQQEVTRLSSDVQFKQTDVELYALKDRVNQLFFSILLFDEQLTLNETMSNDLRIQAEKIEKYIEGGIATSADLDLIRVNLLTLKQQSIELRKNREAFFQMLSTVVGKAIDSSLVMPNVSNMEFSSEVNRPELELFNAQIRLAEGKRSVIQSKNMPRFNFFVQGGYGRPGLNMLKNEFQPFYVGGIRLAWNLGNLYTRKGELKLLENQESQIEVQRHLFMYNTTQQQLKVKNEIDKYMALMADDDEVIRLRGNIRKSSETKTELGTLSVADMMRDLNAEQQARQNKALHKAYMLMSIYSLKYITNNQ